MEENTANDFDIDGDGRVSIREVRLCQICLLSAVILAFGDKAIMLLQQCNIGVTWQEQKYCIGV